MAVDYGFFKALTGPMKQAGAIQANRDARAMQEMQLAQQQKNQQLQELDRKKNQQDQLNAATQSALNDLYTKNNFSRNKDVDDFTNWHETGSGWSDIQEVLRKHGNIDNARIYGNLDYMLNEYKANLKDNPISRRSRKNKASLELYHELALDDKNSQFLTGGAIERYQSFVNNETDSFIFNGGRSDYLDQATKVLTTADQIDLDEVIGSNYQAIIKDMINDQNPENAQDFMNGLSHEDIRNWVGKELRYDKSSGYFNDKGIYGEMPIDTEFSTELVRSLDAVGKTAIATGSDYFRAKDQGTSFKELFDGTAGIDWDRLGGYNSSAEMKNYKGMKATFAKGRQMVGSGRIFANNPNLESIITKVWAGNYGDEEQSTRYNIDNKQVNNVAMQGLYDSRGHKITDSDVGSTWITGAGSWQESETDDLRLTGYHIALEGKNSSGDSFLLTDVSNKEDMAKMREQYKDTVFDYVMVAELIDDDMVSHDDAYYKKVDLGDASIQAAINKAIPSEDLNNVKNQNVKYEQQLANKTHSNKRKLANSALLRKQLSLPDDASVEKVVNAYDQSLSIGLGMANVPSKKIQQAIPLLMSDLYVASQEKREYPIKLGENMVARNSSEYMAYSTQILKKGLIDKSSSVMDMLEAIKKGNYDAWSQTAMPESLYNNSRRISKSIVKYQQ
tara:strand:+ start:16272 stop:18293 length:2022 start_codon:yes stop_codon:yes gene_type:complete